ncbi:MAG: hypothetical protein EP343_09250 [Deltaproteobacteria bacterium]|nr:MAG: hypothetical protein EP343_09250 [Deltaproteobacteria bacterium]
MIHCTDVVVGGGIAGLYACKLLQDANPDASIILLESQPTLGGNIRDVTYSPGEGLSRVTPLSAQNQLPVVPVGPVRINPSQRLIMELADTLGVQSESAFYRDMRVLNRQRVEAEFESFQGYQELEQNAERFRFMGDFEGTDPSRYMEFWEQDVFSPTNLFPVNGFSEFVCKLAQSFVKRGGKALVNTPATYLSWEQSSNQYLIHTPQKSYKANRCIIAVPPIGLRNIKGPIPTFLNAQKFVREIKPVPVTTITMWFDTAWWTALDFQRIWDHSNPLLHVEFFGTKSKLASKAIRVSYADGSAASLFGKQATLPRCQSDAVHEMVKALKSLLPEVANSIPKPLHTHVESFENAWHFEHPGAEVSLSEKRELAAKPYQLNPSLLGDQLCLVGEAYNPHRTWIEGALDSVLYALNETFLNKVHPTFTPSQTSQAPMFT